MEYREPRLFYFDGTEVNGVITNYKPPVPIFKSIKNKPLKGNTRFQTINTKNDTKIKFSIAFNIADCGKDAYKRFISNYGNVFKFIDEWGDTYTGKFEDNIDIDTPIEGDIYYIALEMFCNCEVGGLK